MTSGRLETAPATTTNLSTEIETNRIVVSGASGVGKSLWINPVLKKLLEYGYTVESPRIYIGHAKDGWLQAVHNHPKVKRCTDRFCLIEAVVADAPLCITFDGSLGGVDLFAALNGEADMRRIGFLQEPVPSANVNT